MSQFRLKLHNYNPEKAERLLKLIEYIQQHPTIGRDRLMNETGANQSEAKAALQEFKASAEKEDKQGRFRRAIDVNKFLEDNDPKRILRRGLKEINGKIIIDNDFRIALGISSDNWRSLREAEEFLDYQITIKQKRYWGWPEDLKRLQDSLQII